MGGDFIIGNDGQLALSHRSETPTDRPTANALLKHLQVCDLAKSLRLYSLFFDLINQSNNEYNTNYLIIY